MRNRFSLLEISLFGALLVPGLAACGKDGNGGRRDGGDVRRDGGDPKDAAQRDGNTPPPTDGNQPQPIDAQPGPPADAFVSDCTPA